MQGNKRANTKPELLVRQRLREAGLTGYRLQWKKAPGRPDIAFPGRKIAIFVNGCFWHRCPHCNPSMPKRNTDFWIAKFKRNVERDQAAIAELENLDGLLSPFGNASSKRRTSTKPWSALSPRYARPPRRSPLVRRWPWLGFA